MQVYFVTQFGGGNEEEMQDRMYLLSIAELLAQDAPAQLWKQCLGWLDSERQSRVRGLERNGSLKNMRKPAENIGAGLVLQLAVCQAEAGECEQRTGAWHKDIIRLTLSEALKYLEQSIQNPLPLEYTYGENGKPYLINSPYYFNLSHSGEYIFCVISRHEVGADIQWKRPLKDERIAQRFFSEEEKKALAECYSAREKQDLFYRLWTRKEAFGKLNGQGIAAALGVNMYVADSNKGAHTDIYEQVGLEEYEVEDYQIAICKWKQES